VPAIYHALLRFPGFSKIDVSGVRWVSYGGAPIDTAMVGRIMRAFPNARVGNGFGLTETSSLTSFLPHEEAAAHADSVGFAMPVVDLSIDDPDPDTGVGELLVRGPNVVRGYWRKPEANAETFSDGWLHTGDVARVDEDGLLYIVDRMKDMINRGGENVYSIEVENAISTHPAVAEVAVIGIPDPVWGEQVHAIVVPREGALVSAEEIQEHARGTIAGYKVPKSVEFRTEPLPLSGAMKPLKRELRRPYWEEAR
jgi:acyl-CoA synthetase (AMP-forming)/AMP-acid ligase II